MKWVLLFGMISCILISCSSGNFKIFYIEGIDNVDISTKVRLNGKIIGVVENVEKIDSSKVLVKAKVSEGEKIPSNSSVTYTVNMLGQAYINIEFANGSEMYTRDTLRGVFVPSSNNIDSLKKSKLLKIVLSLKDSIDIILKDSSR